MAICCTIHNENKVVLANRENGRWIRLSEEVYKIIKDILENDISFIVTEEYFDNKEDYDYIREVCSTLIEANIICAESDLLDNQNRIASVQLTNRCNLQCVHCCVDAKVSNDSSCDLNTDSIKNIFDKLILWNPNNIMLSGGEPMIRPDFMELLRYLRNNYEGKIILSTNSLLINNQNVKELVKCCDGLEISIDGIDEETCSKVRGKGVFGQVCKK